MGSPLPIFPLGSVVLPGVTVGIHVFEDRYRDLVSHLVQRPVEDRRFGIVAIREGYEVGDSGVQSVHRVGVEAELTELDALDDGRFDVEVLAGRRLRLDAAVASETFMWGEVEYLPEPAGSDAPDAADRAHAVFDAYRGVLRDHHLESTLSDLPADPVELSYALASTAVLTMRDRQGLLEAPDAATRLRQFTRILVGEIDAMRAVPSLPAVEVARTSWSPN